MRILAFAVGVLGLLGCGVTRGPLSVGDEPFSDVMSVQTPPSDQCNRLDATLPSGPASELEPDTLSLAAECLERGDRAGAATHLECYVCRHPDQWMFRAQLAEMLLGLGRDALARAHFERFIVEAPSGPGPLRGQIINAHTRLMEIAQRANDRFGEHLHRGVGLLLLAGVEEQATEADSDFTEEMLCKALLALKEARELKPSDARTRTYLAEVYDRCGNRRAAGAERAGTRKALVPAELSPGERRNQLVLDCSVR